MKIQQIIKDTMKDHKNKIEIFQWAVMNSVGSLVYSEYIKNIRRKEYPRQHILVPPIKLVSSILDTDFTLMETLSSNLIDKMINNKWFDKVNYKSIPELVLFNDDNIEILKTIFDLYIVKNVSRRIPEVISKKFQIGNSSVKGIIDESNEISIFNNGICDYHYEYLVEETCVQLLTLLPTLKKTIYTPDNLKMFHLTENDILIVDNSNAICPIDFTSNIYSNRDIMDLIGFVTNVSITIPEDDENLLLKNGKPIKYEASSNPFNSTSICNFEL